MHQIVSRSPHRPLMIPRGGLDRGAYTQPAHNQHLALLGEKGEFHAQKIFVLRNALRVTRYAPDRRVGQRFRVSYGDDALRLQPVHHQRKRNRPHRGTDYVINYTVKVTPISGPAITVSSQILFTATASTETVSAKIPLGGLPLGTYSLSGSATLASSGSTVPISFATNPLVCSTSTVGCLAKTSNSANFNGTAISGGSYVWFNSNFTATGIPTKGATVTLTNSRISFTANGVHYNLAIPDSMIVFSSSATCSKVSFDAVNKEWDVTVPVSGSDEIFLSGLAFPVPAAGLPGGIQNVTWSGTFDTGTSGISFHWKWGAAVYTSFSTNYNTLDVKPTHQNACSYNNGDHAGTPENAAYQSTVIGGGTGGGGSNFTGSWSGTVSVTPVCSQ